MSFLDLCAGVGNTSGVVIEQVTSFIELVRLLKPILRWSSNNDNPPLHLPSKIHEFLRDMLDLSDAECHGAWGLVRFKAWEDLEREDALGLRLKHVAGILQHGLSREIGM